jgi:ABC-type transporter Mla subunit MlaD
MNRKKKRNRSSIITYLSLVGLLLSLQFTSCTTSNVYYIRLDDTYGLKENDPVLIRGKEVGKISNIDLTGDQVILTIKLDNKVLLYKSSEASVKDISLLGNKAILIANIKNNGPVLNSNDTISAKYIDDKSLNHLAKKADTLINLMTDSISKRKK